MTDTTHTPGGQNASAGGQSVQTVTDDRTSTGGTTAADDNGQTGGDDKVAYETHRRLLGEKKKIQEERDRLQKEIERRDSEASAAEKKRLEEQGEYKKLLELERKQREELQGKLNTYDETQKQAKKLDAVLNAVGGKIPRKFWGLVDISNVVINPETGEIDAMSVQKTVENLRAEYPEIIRTGNGGGNLPADAAKGGNSGTMTPELWKTLPLDEQKKRYGEYFEMLKAKAGGAG